MKIVLDTNMIISAIGWRGLPDMVMGRVIDGSDTLLLTDKTMQEIKGVIGRPKFDDYRDRAVTITNFIEKFGQKVTVYPHHQVFGVCRDPKDDMYLECAVAAGADCIITGDKDLLVLKEYNGIKIITAKEYLEIVNP